LKRLLVLLILILQACSNPETRPVVWEQDGAPGRRIGAEDVADAIPRPDPLLPAGNTSPYEVNGQRYEVLPTAQNYRAEGVASWYGTKFHGNPTANGEIYDLYLATAAHRSLPIPSYVRVTNLENGRDVVVRVNDRGPFHSERIIDLSYGAAVRLGFVDKGTARVRLEALQIAGIDDRRNSTLGAYRYLQLGAFASEATAANLRDSVAGLVPVPVQVTPVDVAGQRLNRVRLGPVDNPDELKRLQRLLTDRGYNAGLALP
jgi:rare lipoprotein A